MHLQHVRCAEIRPDSRSPGYRDEEVAELAESVRVFGVLRPILLAPAEDGYVIVHGERRWRAACMAGLATVPATLVEHPDGSSALLRAQGKYAAHA